MRSTCAGTEHLASIDGAGSLNIPLALLQAPTVWRTPSEAGLL